jgi:hypothetical protein
MKHDSADLKPKVTLACERIGNTDYDGTAIPYGNPRRITRFSAENCISTHVAPPIRALFEGQ